MEIIYAFIGLAIGVLVMWLWGKNKEKDILRKYSEEINTLKEKQNQEIKDARKKSVQTSRSVLRGKVAEQIAPLLDGFEYSLSDAHFLGDPIDYVVFNGYSNLRDNGNGADDLEIVILEIKSGKARLQKGQHAIENAINAGRVRFETIRVSGNGEITKKGQKPRPIQAAQLQEIQKAPKRYNRADKKWGKQEIAFVAEKYKKGATIDMLAEKIQRPPADVEQKLRELRKLKA